MLPLTIGSACCALTFIAGMVTADLNRPAPRPDTYAVAVNASQQATITLQAALAERDAARLAADTIEQNEARLITETVMLRQTLAERDAARLAAGTIEQNEARLITENVMLRQTLTDEKAITAQWVAFAKTQTDAAVSWKVAYENKTPAAAYTPAPAAAESPYSIANYERQKAEWLAKHNAPAKQPTQIIQTGMGTATIVNPDGTTSIYQSTGEGTGLITTP